MPLPTVSVTGRIGSELELKFMADGKPVLNFSVVADKKRKDDSGNWVDDKVCWMQAAVWGHAANHAAETLAKGMEVVITGALSTRNYQRNDGSQGTSLDLTVYSIGPSLQWDEFRKVEGNQSGGTGAPRQQAPQQQNPWQQPAQQAPQQQNPWAHQAPQHQPQQAPQQAWGSPDGGPPF